MVICINKYPLWSKCHPKNTPVLIYDNWEDKVLYADHYDYQVDNLDYKILTHDDDKEYYLGFDYRTFRQLNVNYHDINFYVGSRCGVRAFPAITWLTVVRRLQVQALAKLLVSLPAFTWVKCSGLS